AHPFEARRQKPVLEGSAISERAGLPGQHRHVMPRIVERLAAAETALMLADDDTFLTDDNPLGIGVDLNRAADRQRRDRVLVIVEANQASLRYRGWHGMEAVKLATVLHQHQPLFREHLPHRLVRLL